MRARECCVVLAVGLLVFAGCGSDDTLTTSDSGATTSVVEVTTTAESERAETVSLSVTFDGENCIYEGPAEITPGPVALDFHNEWDRTDGKSSSAVGLARLLGDTTVQSQIDGIEAGQQHHNPSEVSIVDAAWNPIPTGETYRYQGILSLGTYVMVCNKVIFSEAYWGAALAVTD